MHERVILLKGGPYHGLPHELYKDMPIPDNLGLPDASRRWIAWYTVNPDNCTAAFLKVTPAKHTFA